jgi:integrase
MRAAKGFVRWKGGVPYAVWSVRDPATGKRRQHSKACKTANEAQRFLITTMSSIQEGTWRPEEKLTVAELLRDHYLPARKAEGLRSATLAQYTSVSEAWIIGHIGGVKVKALTPAMVQALVEKLRTEGSTLGRGGLSPRSVQLSITVLKAATAWGLSNGVLSRDPLLGMRRPRAAASKVGSAWSIEEARTFLSAVADDRLIAAWQLALARGPRRGELAGLKWDVVDLERGSIQIVRTRIVVNGEAQDSEPKTDAGKRRVPLDALLISALKSHKARQSAEQLAAPGGAWVDSGYVFTDELGRAYYPDYFSNRFDKLQAAAGMRRLRLHDCRHTAASVMLDAGEEPAHVSRILGHSSTRITEEIYRHIMAGRVERTGEVISNILLG